MKDLHFPVKTLCLTLLCGLYCMSCKQDPQENIVCDEIGFTLSTETVPASRTHLGEESNRAFPVYWSDGDCINVNGTTSAPLQGVSEQQTSATFKIRGLAAPYRIIYPASAYAGEISSQEIRIRIPDTQNYTEDSFAEGSALMFAYCQEEAGNSVQFTMQHLCGVLCLPMTSPADGSVVIRSIELSSQGAMPPAGEFTFNPGSGELTPSTATQSLCLDFGEQGLTLGETPVPVYITLPKGTYDGFDICMATPDGKLLGASWGNGTQVTVHAGEIVRFESIAFTPTHYNICSAADWERFAAAVNAGDYTEWVDPRTNEVNLQADITTDGNFTRLTQDWDGVFNGNGHTITEKASISPLFTKIAASGTVKNLILEGSCTECEQYGSQGTVTLAVYNYGTIEQVTNRINTELKNLSTATLIGGMVGWNAGMMRDCTQEGNISVSYNLTKSINTYAGGVSCFAADTTEPESDDSSVSIGSFERCKNLGNICIDKSGASKLYMGKFSIGGICSIVQQGSPEKYSSFIECSNSGTLYRRDDQNGSNTFSTIGGIVGRVCSYPTVGALGVTDTDRGFYAEFIDCSNTGTIENAAYLTNGFTSETVSGARMGPTGGIVGYMRGLPDHYALISGCSNTGIIRGGQSINSMILGGLAGMTQCVHIKQSTANTTFNDAVLPASVTLTVGAIGGLVGYVRGDTLIEDCSAHTVVNMQAAVSYAGLCAGGVYAPSDNAPTLTVNTSQVSGDFSYAAGNTHIETTPENFTNYLCPFGQTAFDQVTYLSEY